MPTNMPTIRTKRFRPIAMSVLASGALTTPKRGLGKVESIVFGASSAQNIKQTKALIDQHFNNI
jgi:hypothetical protein